MQHAARACSSLYTTGISSSAAARSPARQSRSSWVTVRAASATSLRESRPSEDVKQRAGLANGCQGTRATHCEFRPRPTQVRVVVEGDKIGAYRVLQRIGEGGMGEVWMAEHTALG